MVKRSVFTTFAFLIAAHMLVSCGDSGSASDEEMIWKLDGLDQVSYRINVSGQELVDLYSLAPGLADDEDFTGGIKEDENSQSEDAYLKSPKVKMTVKGNTYAVLNKRNPSRYRLEHVSGLLRYRSELDTLIMDKEAQKKADDLFKAANGLTLNDYDMNENGEVQPAAGNHFRYMNFAFRLPPDQIFLNNSAALEYDVLDKDGAETCISIPSTENFVRKVESSVKLDKLKQSESGDIIAEMSYKVSERISNSAYENPGADSFFLNTFTRANENFRLRFGVRFDESQRASKDERQIIFHCKYAGKHVFNITRGWILRVDGLFSVSAYRKIEPDSSRELARYKFSVVPIPNEDVARKTKSDYLKDIDNIVKMESREDGILNLGSLLPSLNNKGSLESGQQKTNMTAAQASKEESESQSLPIKVTVNESTPNQTPDIEETKPYDNWRQLQKQQPLRETG